MSNSQSDEAILAKLIDSTSQEIPVYKWTEDFQRILLGALLCNRFFLCQSLGLVKATYFSNEIHILSCRILLDYFQKYNQLPSKIWMRQAVTDFLREKYQNDADTFGTLRLLYVAELNTVYDFYSRGGVGDMMPDLDSSEAILDKVTAFAKTQAIRQAFNKCLDIIRKNPEADATWATVDDILKEARLVDRQTDLGLDYFNTVEERYERMATAAETVETFTTGFKNIDDSLPGGGLYRGELGAWMGLPGSGKTHLAGTEILMYDGTIKKVQDIIAGELVMGDDSTPRKVLNTHCLRDKIYEIKPVKGASYFVNSKHVLCLKNSHRQGALRKDRPTKRRKNPSFHKHPSRVGDTNVFNISVEDWFKQSAHFKGKMKGWRTGVDWPERQVAIDPYILGAWLGDGDSNGPAFTNVDEQVIDSIYDEASNRNLDVTNYKMHYRIVSDYQRRHSPGRGLSKNTFQNDLRACGLLRNKHIPFDYKINSRKNRLELLAGLMDTDGYKDCGFEITQKSEVLAKDILFLVRSLGFSAYLSKCKKKSQNGTVGDYFRMCIHGNCDEIPVRIPRKKCSPRRQIKNHLHTGIKVIPHDRYGVLYGFETDGNHLYLLGDFTVVHNSLALVTATVKNIVRGKKILYLSTEMESDRIAARFDAQFSSVGHHELMLRKEEVWAALRDWSRDYEDKRRLIIKQFPSGTADVNTVRAFHSQCVMNGFRPDILICDYPGDMKHPYNVPLHQSMQRMITELRGFGGQERHLTLVAIQPNRGPKDNDLGVNDFLDENRQGDSFGQNRVLDAFWTLNQTKHEQKANLGRVFVAKARNGRSRFNFKIRYGFKDQTLMIEEISDNVYANEMSRIRDTDADDVQIDKVVRPWTPDEGERM